MLDGRVSWPGSKGLAGPGSRLAGLFCLGRGPARCHRAKTEAALSRARGSRRNEEMMDPGTERRGEGVRGSEQAGNRRDRKSGHLGAGR